MKIIAPFTGWYSVSVGSFNGDQSFYTDFLLAIGRYNGGNPNCAGATAPSGTVAPSAASSGAESGSLRRMPGGTMP